MVVLYQGTSKGDSSNPANNRSMANTTVLSMVMERYGRLWNIQGMGYDQRQIAHILREDQNYLNGYTGYF